VPWKVGGFTEEAMGHASGNRTRIKDLPFLAELIAGTLPADTFAFYLKQDSLYLREYSKVQASLASRAPTPAITQNMVRAADMALTVEGALHEVFLSKLSSETIEERRLAEPSPTCAAYTNWMQAKVGFAAYEVAFAAAMPCYTVYAEVGRHILSTTKSTELATHPYKAWIETYGGEDFEAATLRATTALDELAEKASPSVRAEMLLAFRQGVRFEWMFWDSAYRREKWPMALD